MNRNLAAAVAIALIGGAAACTDPEPPVSRPLEGVTVTATAWAPQAPSSPKPETVELCRAIYARTPEALYAARTEILALAEAPDGLGAHYWRVRDFYAPLPSPPAERAAALQDRYTVVSQVCVNAGVPR